MSWFQHILTAGNIYAPGFALRRRVDGGYAIAVPGRGTLNVAPQGLRYATKFYQMYRAKLVKKLKYRINSSFWNGPEAEGRWHNDQVSLFEKIRVFDPAPDCELVKIALQNLGHKFPALQGVKVAASWSAMIGTSSDLVLVISKVDQLSGLIIASGFSGHGFGIGPGAGRLVSEFCLSETPFVDPAPYGLSRFSD